MRNPLFLLLWCRFVLKNCRVRNLPGGHPAETGRGSAVQWACGENLEEGVMIVLSHRLAAPPHQLLSQHWLIISGQSVSEWAGGWAGSGGSTPPSRVWQRTRGRSFRQGEKSRLPKWLLTSRVSPRLSLLRSGFTCWTNTHFLSEQQIICYR